MAVPALQHHVVENSKYHISYLPLLQCHQRTLICSLYLNACSMYTLMVHYYYNACWTEDNLDKQIVNSCNLDQLLPVHGKLLYKICFRVCSSGKNN